MSIVHTILKHIGGVEQYGVFSLCLFSSIFAGVLIYTFFQKKQHLDYMSRVALETADGEETPGDGCASSSCCCPRKEQSGSTAPILKDSHE
jgi:hypothetical protein